VDAGAEGEWLAARLRLPVMALLLVLPTMNYLDSPTTGAYLTGLVVTIFAALVAVAIYLVLWRGGYRPWLGFASSTLDVSLVSLGLASFLWVGDPHAAVNSKPTFEIYFLSVLGSSLRYDRRICITAGLTACLQYLAIVAYASTRWELNDPMYAPFPYGMFSWVPQVGRLILLFASMLLAWEIVRRAQRLRRHVTHDPVTGLPRRRAFEARAAGELARARRYGYDVSVVDLDLDGFGAFVRDHGRRAGDAALSQVGRRLESGLRAADIVAHLGDGRFVLVLPDVPPQEAQHKVDALRDELRWSPVRAGGDRERTFSITAGVAAFPRDGSDLERLLWEAEAGKHRAVQARRRDEADLHARWSDPAGPTAAESPGGTDP
jgi:diguanylate cyclase (GGDEF)-like protein